MVLIKELEIRNCLSFGHVHLYFEDNKYATIFNCAPAYHLKNNLIRAIQQFFCKDMITMPMEGKPDTEMGLSFIRIKFLITNKEGKDNDVVEAMRVSRKPSKIFYYFNGEPYIDRIQVYHERCGIDVSSFYPFLNETSLNEHKNVLHHWVTFKCPLRSATEKSFDILADYLELCNTRPHSEQQRIVDLAQTNLLIDRECELLKKRTFVDIANEIGRIFNFITFDEYTVQFCIPLCGENLNMQRVKWEDMTLSKVETYIKKTHGNDTCIWHQLEPGLKNLLVISRLIALATHLEQKCIFIEDTTVLQEFQNQQMIKEAIIQKDGVDTEADWNKKNFIKQIVDVCNEMKKVVFINYHGCLPLPPKNANIIKCRDSRETDGQSIYVCNNWKSMELNDFLALFIPSGTF